MTPNETRERLILLLTGAILSSAQDNDQLRNYARCLSLDQNIIDEVVSRIKSLENSSTQAAPEKPTDDYGEAILDMALNTLRSSGISKNDLINLMLHRAPNFNLPTNIGKMGFKELLRRFANQTSYETVKKLLISNNKSSDPYLTGIRTDNRRSHDR